MKYLVVIPAYNEEERIGDVVRGVLSRTSHVLVVDDGSTDSTREVIESLGVPFVTQSHSGKGSALRAGFRYAVENGFDWVVTMDGDGQHDPGDLPAFERALRANGCDMIVGTRMEGARAMPVVRYLTNRSMSYIISRLSGTRLPDSQCGFRAISTRLLDAIKLTTSHYDTESEVIVKASRAGYRISNIPVNTIYNGSKSSINKFTDTLRFIRLVWDARGDD